MDKAKPAPGWKVYPINEDEPEGMYEIEHDSGDMPSGEMNDERTHEDAIARTWEIYESGWRG